MKRRVLCVFSLIFWLIILCTILSARVEQLMMPTVEVEELNMPLPETSISADALFYDELGMHLYKTAQGFGWDTGMRVYEYDGFILDDGRLSQLDYGWFILYATRDLRLGEEVLVREEPYLYMDDTWVAIYPNGVPAYSFASDTMTALAQTDTALLVSAPGADYPFMEGRARASIETEKSFDYYMQAPDSAVYSLNDLYRFMNSILLLALLISLILFSIAIWVRCCKLSRERKKNRRALVRNSILAALVVTGIVLVSQWINLPNSLLPKTRITDFSYYAAEFSALFSALHDLAGQGGAAAENAVRYAESHVILAGVVVLAGILLSVGKIIFGAWRDKIRSKPKPKHAAW